jgi:hypothetical protein
MAEDEIKAMSIQFSGMRPGTGEIVSIGSLLLHPSGAAMVVGPGPDHEISMAVVMSCMQAADTMCRQLPDDVSDELKLRHYAVRAVLYQMLDRVDDLASVLRPDDDEQGTLQ